MFNTLGLETPPWSTKRYKSTAMVLPKKPALAGMFAPTSPPACLIQSDLITIPGQSTLLAIQIATSLAGFSWFVPWKMDLCGRPLCLRLPWTPSHSKASGEQNPDLISGPRQVARSILYSSFVVRHGHRDLAQRIIRSQLRRRSLTRKGLESVRRGLLADDPDTRLVASGDGRSGVHNHVAFVLYIIFNEAVVAVNQSRGHVSINLWFCTELPRWRSHLHSQPIDRQSRLRVRTVCLSFMTR